LLNLPILSKETISVLSGFPHKQCRHPHRQAVTVRPAMTNK